jgi:hypothetical protein
VAHNFEPEAPVDFRPVIVMFSPTGAVDRVYYTRRVYAGSPPAFSHCAYLGGSVVEPIHFLVGKWERLPGTPRLIDMASPPAMPLSWAEDGVYNRQDASNLWVTLNPQTGLVTVAELRANLPPGHALNPFPNVYVPGDPGGSDSSLSRQLYEARQYAREAQISKGGR